jgi:predicted ATPase
MLTKLEVDGFKNLRGVQVYLGPFTCISGPNGVGKSNLFDAIAFLSALAQMPLMDAALSVRGAAARHGDIRNLFHRVGDRTSATIRFGVEMLVPEEGEDGLGQQAKASMTFLRYELALRYREDPTVRSMGTLEIEHERMVHINRTSARKHLPLPHEEAWRDSVVKGKRTSPYISTEHDEGQARVSLHADSIGGKGGGRPNQVPAANLPRTMLSTVTNAAEHRTLVLARQEMTSWTQLHLEPTALRAPDSFTAPRSIAANGLHLPVTLHSLARDAERDHPGGASDLYARVANRLSELIENVRDLVVDVDEKRQLFSIVLTDRHGTSHVASALSDGTLRFLALTVMEADPHGRGLLCLEEPENGMHPARIPAVIKLLGDIAVDVSLPVDSDNPLRQVIINTHSPSVVACVDHGALLAAHELRVKDARGIDAYLSLRCLSKTWRAQAEPGIAPIGRGDLVAYLNPLAALEADSKTAGGRVGATMRVFEREDLQLLLPIQESA